MDHVELAFKFASDLAKQLITLATGILALTIAFAKELDRGRDPDTSWRLRYAWAGYFVSIAFGVLALMGLTGSLNKPSAPTAIGGSAKLYGAVQIIAFFAATSLAISFGWRLMTPRQPAVDEEQGEADSEEQ